MDEDGFAMELKSVSEEMGLVPSGGHRLTTSYFDDAEVDVGNVQPWIKAKPLQIILTKDSEMQPSQLWR